MTIYGNWSAYDELSDGVPLTEELAMRQLREVVRLKSLGVRFDAYLMDAFWFDPDGGYRTWRKPNWPDGPQGWLDVCAEHGLIPGLWFTANTLCHINPAQAWKDSVDANNWGMCCFQGGFLADYVDVLGFWYGQGIRIFKLDFADFTAAPPGLKAELPVEEIRARNQEAFREALLGFRLTHPDARFLGFNGFESVEYMDRTDRPLECVIDLRWLEVFDSIYSGDPRPADVPCVPFWRSVDIYGDHTTRVLEHSGVPTGRIDNCGFMAGPTGTCCWRGKAMWKGMFLLTLARGGILNVLYGDMSQFDEADAIWMAKAQALFEGKPQSVGFGGVPGSGEAYGWALGEDLCAVVNPQPTPSDIDLVERPWRILFTDSGFVPALSEGSIELGPYQMAILGIDGPSFGVQQDCVSQVRKRAYCLVVDRSPAKMTVDFAPGDLRIVVRQRDADGRLVRTFSGSKSAASAISIQAWQVDVEIPVVRHDDKVVWSGMSWAIADLIASGEDPVRIFVEAHDPLVAKLEVEIWSADAQSA